MENGLVEDLKDDKSMMVRWMKMKMTSSFGNIIIEGDITIKDLYHLESKLFLGKGVLISTIDNQSVFSSELFLEQLSENSIKFKSIGSAIFVEFEHVTSLFKNTDFGESQDSCFFLKSPRKKGVNRIIDDSGLVFGGHSWNKRIQAVALELMSNNDLYVSYINIPDLFVFSKDLVLIKFLEKRFKDFLHK